MSTTLNMKSTNLSPSNMTLKTGATKKAIDTLRAEGGESFYNYINWLGLAKEPDLIVCPQSTIIIMTLKS